MTSSRVGAPLIEARNITKHYDGFTLQGVSLTVEPGQIVGFIGQNGAGKSTTIKALLGIIGIDAGDARILGVDARGLSGADAAVKERVGVVFDTVSMPPHIKIAEVGKLMDRAYQTWDARVFEEYLHRFKLDSKKAIKELSRGMGMKLSLACALAHNPQVLILDEATAGLDPIARDEVLDILREFMAVEGHAILLSTHITSDLEKIADWQSKGAQLTDAVAALVKAANEGEKTAAAPKKSKKQLAKEAEEAARKAEEEAAAAPAAAPKAEAAPAAEAPKAEAPKAEAAPAPEAKAEAPKADEAPKAE